MRALSLTSIPGVIAVETTPNTARTGHWKILISDQNIPVTIQGIDAALLTQPQSFPDTRPNRRRKAIESMPLANQTAWLHQNKDFTATPPLKPNAWLKHGIHTVRTKAPPPKPDDKSTSTLNTTTTHREELDSIQQMLQKLHSSEAENKKMRDSFAAYRAEKRQHTIQAKSDLELLKEVNKQLIQTTTDLQQQVTLLQQETFSDIQRIDLRITGLENTTNTLAQNTLRTSSTVTEIKSHLEA